MNSVSTKSFLAAATFLFFAFLSIVTAPEEHATFSSLLSLAIVSALAAFVVAGLIGPDGRVQMTLARPMSLYGCFYFLYYLLPYLTLYFRQELPQGQELKFATMLLLGYFGLQVGTAIGRQPEIEQSGDWINKEEAKALLAVCLFGIAATATYYFWRAEQGAFNYQAGYVEQDTTLVESFRGVFAQVFQLPIILLLGLLSSVTQGNIARFAKRLLFAYGIGIAVVMVASSQTRPAITAILFVYLATRFYRREATKLWHVAVVSASCIVAIVIVQSVRIVGIEPDITPSQSIAAIGSVIPDAFSTISGQQAEMGERLLSRGGGSLAFLGEIATAIENRGAPFYGQGVLESLWSLIPRFLWPDKPAVSAPQGVAQELLGFPVLYDSSLGPITQFYFEGGWIGIFLCYALFGWAMAWLTNRSLRSRSIGFWIALCFIWGHVANVELEVVIGVLGTLRSALAVYIIWRICLFFFKTKKTVPSSGAMAESGWRR